MSAIPDKLPPRPAPPASGRGAIALALGGGAALGWAHIGVLRVLAEEGIAIGAVAGTSIGAIAAVCLASDRLDMLERIATGATRGQVFGYLDPHLGRGAVLGGRRIARQLEQHLGDVRLEHLHMPISIVAADIGTREEVRLTHGAAIRAVQASIALPGLFRPVAIEGRVLVDGGMAACVPVGAARAIAAGLPVVAVSLLDAEPRTIPQGGSRLSALQVLGASFLTLMTQQTRAAFAIDPPEVLIRPAIGHLSTGAFTQAAELIALGRQAAIAALPQIAAALDLPKI